MVLGRLYKFGLVAVKAEEAAFVDALKRVYEYHECDLDPTDYVICVNRQGSTLWQFEGIVQRQVEGDLPKALGVFDDIVDQLIKDSVCDGDVLIHASTCVNDGRALSFVGLSGAGKTTLSLMLAKRFSFQMLGDEYALLNFEKCFVSHEFHPLQIKRESPLFEFDTCQNAVASFLLESSLGVNCRIVSPSDFGLNFSSASCRLDTLIFPLFRQVDCVPQLKPLSVGDLPELLMPSVQRSGPGGDLFRRLVSTLAKHSVRMYSLSYGNPYQACELIEGVRCEGGLFNG